MIPSKTTYSFTSLNYLNRSFFQSEKKLEEVPKIESSYFLNSAHEFVKPGKERLVGFWLLITAGSVFFMILLGGYTRLSKSGLSMTKWKPIAYKYPSTKEEWNEEFENYKVKKKKKY